MSETVTTCTCSLKPGTCSASPAVHVRGAAEAVVRFAAAYDANAHGCAAQVARQEQAAALYRDICVLQGVDRSSREHVGLYVLGAVTHLCTMAMLGPVGAATAYSSAKMLLLALPLIEDLARG